MTGSSNCSATPAVCAYKISTIVDEVDYVLNPHLAVCAYIISTIVDDDLYAHGLAV